MCSVASNENKNEDDALLATDGNIKTQNDISVLMSCI